MHAAAERRASRGRSPPTDLLDAPLEEVVIAARDGDVDAIEGFLDAGLDVSAPQDTDGRTLLYHACLANQPAVVKLLLQR